MAARLEKTLVMNYLLRMHGLGAAAPGELPGETGHFGGRNFAGGRQEATPRPDSEYAECPVVYVCVTVMYLNRYINNAVQISSVCDCD